VEDLQLRERQRRMEGKAGDRASDDAVPGSKSYYRPQGKLQGSGSVRPRSFGWIGSGKYPSHFGPFAPSHRLEKKAPARTPGKETIGGSSEVSIHT
jgi:hypothetical protein